MAGKLRADSGIVSQREELIFYPMPDCAVSREQFLALFLPLALGQTFACTANDQPLPLRRDCIVKIQIEWPAQYRSASEREGLIREISNAMVMSGSRGGPPYLADQAIPRGQRDVIYLQFEKKCADRLEMARDLVAYVDQTVPGSPELLVSPEVVEPSTETIEVWGPSWSDSPD